MGFLNVEGRDEVLEKIEAYQDVYKPRYDPVTGRRLFDIDIKDVRVWSDAAGAVPVKSWNYAREVHEEKLSKLRKMKEWQTWCQEDEEDVEGEKVISDIRNLYNETYFNVYFTEIDHGRSDYKTAMEQKVS